MACLYVFNLLQWSSRSNDFISSRNDRTDELPSQSRRGSWTIDLSILANFQCVNSTHLLLTKLSEAKRKPWHQDVTRRSGDLENFRAPVSHKRPIKSVPVSQISMFPHPTYANKKIMEKCRKVVRMGFTGITSTLTPHPVYLQNWVELIRRPPQRGHASKIFTPSMLEGWCRRQDHRHIHSTPLALYRWSDAPFLRSSRMPHPSTASACRPVYSHCAFVAKGYGITTLSTRSML